MVILQISWKRNHNIITICYQFIHSEPTAEDVYNVPDRITGLQGLSVLNPQRKWNFVHINITKEELQNAR